MTGKLQLIPAKGSIDWTLYDSAYQSNLHQFDGVYETPEGDFLANAQTGEYFRLFYDFDSKVLVFWSQVSELDFMQAIESCPSFYKELIWSSHQQILPL